MKLLELELCLAMEGSTSTASLVREQGATDTIALEHCPVKVSCWGLARGSDEVESLVCGSTDCVIQAIFDTVQMRSF